MNIDYFIYASFGLAVILLLTNYIDFSYIISKLFFSKVNNTIPLTPVETDKEKEFLHLVSLWFQLKEKCEDFNLKIACEKLDEVFILLNGALDDES